MSEAEIISRSLACEVGRLMRLGDSSKERIAERLKPLVLNIISSARQEALEEAARIAEAHTVWRVGMTRETGYIKHQWSSRIAVAIRAAK